MDPMDLVNFVRGTTTINQFVNGKDIVYALAELELDAAIAAVEGLHLASDKKSQIWSAINHLQAAERKSLQAVQSGLTVNLVAHVFILRMNTRFSILGLLCILYIYVGEHALAEDTLEKMETEIYRVRRWRPVDRKASFWFTLVSLPLIPFQKAPKVTIGDPEEFISVARSNNSPFDHLFR